MPEPETPGIRVHQDGSTSTEPAALPELGCGGWSGPPKSGRRCFATKEVPLELLDLTCYVKPHEDDAASRRWAVDDAASRRWAVERAWAWFREQFASAPEPPAEARVHPPCENDLPDCTDAVCRSDDDVPLCIRCFVGLAVESETGKAPEGRLGGAHRESRHPDPPGRLPTEPVPALPVEERPAVWAERPMAEGHVWIDPGEGALFIRSVDDTSEPFRITSPGDDEEFDPHQMAVELGAELLRVVEERDALAADLETAQTELDREFAERERLAARVREMESRTCPGCGGEKEVYVGSAVPGDEGFQPCPLCDGSGHLPTPEELLDLRQRYHVAVGDLQAAQENEISELRARVRELEAEKGDAEDVISFPTKIVRTVPVTVAAKRVHPEPRGEREAVLSYLMERAGEWQAEGGSEYAEYLRNIVFWIERGDHLKKPPVEAEGGQP